MIKVLLDTDIGGDIDDAICLAYLLKEPKCELLGITTVCGNPQERASVASAICKTVNRNIPIVAGMDITLQPIGIYPTPDGVENLKNWEHDKFEQSDAPKFLYEKIKENPHEVILVGIGNMTNIATMFKNYPDSVYLLKGLYVMNGYFGKEKLPEAWYNWNSWADPLASKIVFESKVAIHRAITLEITDQLTIERQKAEQLLKSESKLIEAVFSFGNAWLESSNKLTLHDPLAAVCIFHEDVCKFERGFVSVETENKDTMGGTVFTSNSNGNVEISTDVNMKKFYEIISTTLNG